MKPLLTVICEDVINEDKTNMVSIIKIVHNIKCLRLPGQLPKLCFFCILEKSKLESDDFNGTFRMRQNGKTEMSMPMTVMFQGNERLNMTMKIEPVQVKRKGELEMTLLIGDKVIASASIEIILDIPLISKDGIVGPTIM